MDQKTENVVREFEFDDGGGFFDLGSFDDLENVGFVFEGGGDKGIDVFGVGGVGDLGGVGGVFGGFEVDVHGTSTSETSAGTRDVSLARASTRDSDEERVTVTSLVVV